MVVCAAKVDDTRARAEEVTSSEQVLDSEANEASGKAEEDVVLLPKVGMEITEAKAVDEDSVVNTS